MSNTTFSGPVTATNGFVGDVVGLVQVPTYDVDGAPSAAGIAGALIYVSNGAAGAPILAFSDGTDWLRSDTGAAIATA